MDTRSGATPFERHLQELLDEVAGGATSVEQATVRLRDLPFTDLGYAKVDHHRELRGPLPEIVYAPGKDIGQLEGILSRLMEGNAGPILVSRAEPSQCEVVRRVASGAGLAVQEVAAAGAIAIIRNIPAPAGRVAIVTAGTADLPVAREAELTASLTGCVTELHADAGVAGLHRVMAIRDALGRADVIIVVAGMEGALPSVVGGLVDCPVIACPTSVGYGASFGGLAALLAMLSSCVPGVVCVNVDDGVGAGFAAGLIARRASRVSP